MLTSLCTLFYVTRVTGFYTEEKAVLGSVFLDAIVLVKHKDEILSLDKLRGDFFFIRAAYRHNNLKRRIM